MVQYRQMTNILEKPLTELGFSDEFIELATRMGFRNMAEIVATPPADLLKKQHFSYHWLEELTAWLTKQQLTALLQPLPGNSVR